MICIYTNEKYLFSNVQQMILLIEIIIIIEKTLFFEIRRLIDHEYLYVSLNTQNK